MLVISWGQPERLLAPERPAPVGGPADVEGAVKTQQQLLADVMRLSRISETENWDPWFGPEPPTGTAQAPHRERWSAFYLARWPQVMEAAARLADPASRELMYRLILYRILGHGHVRLTLNTPAYWDLRRAVEQQVVERDVARSWHVALDRIRYAGLDYLGYSGAMLVLLWLGQYRFERDGVRIAPEPGDVVLDAGSYVGDTALVFARDVGPAGHVYAFEFVAENVALLEANLATNPELAERISLVPQAVGRRSGETLHYVERGPATALTREAGAATGQTETVRIDDFVTGQGLDRVDFIKMDIEGAEPDALRGAAGTIRRFRPKLAISAYHSGSDLFELPLLIAGLLPDYQLYLDHYTIREQETVLYAVPSVPK
jgi:FkbM family methyltransferase